jgi:hypothetical protein
LFEETRFISTTECEDGTVNKLSKQNCDEIFEVVDVEKLADEYIVVKPKYREHEHNLAVSAYKEGFHKAMELNKDKQFTLEDVLNAYMEGTNDGTQFESLMDYDSEDFDEAHEFAKEAEKEFRESLQQPTEIEVEIEMELHPTNHASGLELTGNKLMDVAILENYQPKLDKNGCLILKKI